MGQTTGIEWCDSTFNAWWGCTKVSPECDHCYAESGSNRYGFKIWGQDAPRRFFSEKHFNEPLTWNAEAAKAGVRRRVFCSSYSDIMEDRADINPQLDFYRGIAYDLIRATPWLDWLLVTKRPQNFRRFLPKEWLSTPQPNVWLMTTVGVRASLWRINELKKTPAVVHGISFEPLLEDLPTVRQHLGDIEWAIVGGESGISARPAHPEWIRRIRDACQSYGTAFFFKQWGSMVPASQVALPSPITHAMTVDGTVAPFNREDMVAADRYTTRWEGLRRVRSKNGIPALLDETEHKQFPEVAHA